MADDRFATDVFVNCPFDRAYRDIFDAIIFTVSDCGFRPRCALELEDSGQVRLEKIISIIRGCRLGVHDLSRTELDEEHGLPRFNMPFELGLFVAAQRFGSGKQKQKKCLILDQDRYRFQKFLSDIAGQDIQDHQRSDDKAIRRVRDWLRSQTDRPLPGGTEIVTRYRRFRTALPRLCEPLALSASELVFADYTYLIALWLRENF